MQINSEGYGESAVLEVRVFPWRIRSRVMDPDRLRDLASDPIWTVADFDDIYGLAFSLAALVLAPVLVIVIAGVIFAFELPLIIALAAGVVVARFLGIIPWTVSIRSSDGLARIERYRLISTAVRRVRAVNETRRVSVRWQLA